MFKLLLKLSAWIVCYLITVFCLFNSSALLAGASILFVISFFLMTSYTSWYVETEKYKEIENNDVSKSMIASMPDDAHYAINVMLEYFTDSIITKWVMERYKLSYQQTTDLIIEVKNRKANEKVDLPQGVE